MQDKDIREMHYTKKGFNNLGSIPTYRHEHTQKHNGLALGCVILHYGFVSERVCVCVRVSPFAGAVWEMQTGQRE